MTPGSVEAVFNGCTCPILDNCHGEGYHGQAGVFIYTSKCPVHDEERIAKFVADVNEIWPEAKQSQQ